MTQFGDNIYTGENGLTSALSSKSGGVFQKTVRLSGASGTTTVTFSVATQNLQPRLYMMQQGSAATSNSVVCSAGGVTLFTYTSFGSANGLLQGPTVAGLATFTPVAPAMAALSQTSEVAASVTYTSTDAASVSQLVIQFNRSDSV